MYLGPATTQQSADEFWNARLAKFATEGKKLRHGVAKAWFPNGKLESEGTYQFGKKSARSRSGMRTARCRDRRISRRQSRRPMGLVARERPAVRPSAATRTASSSANGAGGTKAAS